MSANVAALYSPPERWSPADWTKPDGDLDLSYDRNEPPVRQTASWTCSCAALAWVMNALGADAPNGEKWDEWTGVNELRRIAGFGAVSPDYGLAYASGVDLEKVYNEYGYRVEQRPVEWPDLAYLCEQAIGQLGGARWYHWTGVRGYDGAVFNLANPAFTWKNVGDELDAGEWDYWGRWLAVMVVGVV